MPTADPTHDSLSSRCGKHSRGGYRRSDRAQAEAESKRRLFHPVSAPPAPRKRGSLTSQWFIYRERYMSAMGTDKTCFDFIPEGGTGNHADPHHAAVSCEGNAVRN